MYISTLMEKKMKKILLKFLVLSLFVLAFTFCATSFTLAGDSRNIIPPSPGEVTASNSVTGVCVTWSTAEKVAGYKIYRSTNGGENEEIADLRGCYINSYSDVNVCGGEKYTYSVCSYNAHNDSPLTNSAELTHISCPRITTLENAVEGIRLEWKCSESSDGYVIYKSTNTKYKRIRRITDPSKTEFVDKDVKVGVSNQYKIIALKGGEQSAASAKKSKPFIQAPVPQRVSNGDGYVKFQWQKCPNAEEYVIYKKTDGSAWSKVATVGGDKNSYSDKSVSGGSEYTYTVKAKTKNSISGYHTGLTITYINAPVMKSATNTSDKIVVKWSEAEGAVKYVVYRKTANTEWEKIGTVKGEKYSDSAIKNGEKYFYSVASVTADNVKSAKATKSIECFALKTPESIKATCSRSGVKISWKNMGSADEYIVYRKDSKAGSWKKLGSVGKGKTSFSDKTAKDGKTYYYTVKQIKGSYKGSYDKNGLKVLFALAPELMLAHSPNGVVIGWSKSELATGYKIERKAEGEDWKKVAEIKGKKNTEYVHKKPAFGKLNYYRITVLTDENVSLVSTAKTIYGIDPDKPMVALTYDDGPYTPVTTRILDTLEKYDARATFFVVGSRVNTYKDCIKRSFDMGCEIGNHTYNHTILTSVGSAKIKEEINATNKAVEKITGVAPVVVRTPGGAVNSTVRSSVMYPMFNWSVDTLDWKNRNASSVVSAIKKDVRDGSIVLMHDLYGSTASATETIVPWLVKEGYQLVTVSELMAVKGIDAEAGKLYNNAY